MFWHRLVSALIGIPVLIAAVWYGGIFLLALTAALMLLGIREFSAIVSKMGYHVDMVWVVTACFILLFIAYQYSEGYPGTALVLILFFFLLGMVLSYPRITPVDVAVAFFGVAYVGLIIYLFLISTLDNGRTWLILMLLGTWANDTLAFLVGRKWGNRRMAPLLSPGKTLEGALGGVLGSIAVGFAAVSFNDTLALWPTLLLGALVGFAAQIGDLVESAIKRQAGIKDAGKLIPGHGGVLDRFDSMLFTAPLVYYYAGSFLIS